MFRHSICFWNTLKEKSSPICQIPLPVKIWSQERAKCKLVRVFRKGRVASLHVNFNCCCSPPSSCPPQHTSGILGPTLMEKSRLGKDTLTSGRAVCRALGGGSWAGLLEVCGLSISLCLMGSLTFTLQSRLSRYLSDVLHWMPMFCYP